MKLWVFFKKIWVKYNIKFYFKNDSYAFKKWWKKMWEQTNCESVGSKKAKKNICELQNKFVWIAQLVFSKNIEDNVSGTVLSSKGVRALASTDIC